MKVVYFERKGMSKKLFIYSCIEGFYVPSENVILLFRDQIENINRRCISVVDKSPILKEIRSVLERKIIKINGITYSKFKEFEYDDSEIKELIQNARLEEEMKEKVESRIETILKEIK